MLRFLKNKNCKQSKTKSQIISESFTKEENFWNNMNDNPYILTGIFEVVGVDSQLYKIIADIDDTRKMEIFVYFNGERISKVCLYGNFDRDSKQDFFLERIESQNPKYSGFGWGTILMKCMFKTLNEYCKINNYDFKRIFGTIGVGGGDTPEKSMPLYLSFDNYPFNENHKLHLQKEIFNIRDRRLEYLIA